ncbi:hypothetical protein B0H63DRAFT_298024 [Podospora didyma]|uniref:Extracellular matrix protein n=1 Tax=Podospora didyma TaxID=330526 RepID=A0AAE0K9C3_9PEZI|nr:hypothetical protein B0H63DRAFT_298024 [Podospora didyma]
MKFSIVSIVSALAAFAAARPAFTTITFDVRENVPFTLEWIGASAPVTIEVLSGTNQNDLTPKETLATGVTTSSTAVTLKNLPSGMYAFRISDGVSEPNYSVLFAYVGTGVASTTSKSTTSAASSTSVTSAASSASSAASSTSSGSSATSASSTTGTRSSTSTSSTSSPTGTPLSGNNGQQLSSPFALLLVPVAAFFFFN